jgi:cyclomaltodextrinase
MYKNRKDSLMNHWIDKAVFYHIYPLGFCGAPLSNDFQAPASARLEQIYAWLDHIQSIGSNAIYLGPVFESTSHGYDTVDYFQVDRRLGTNTALASLSKILHTKGIHLILDAVFNHVGRDFWAFKDVQIYKEKSIYKDWFYNLRFDRRSPYGDSFSYEGWNGHYNLVKLNLSHPAVKEHLFQAVKFWMDEFEIDGLRLDAADCLDFNFMKELAAYSHNLRQDFWLMGEVIHGDYRHWANQEMLDSVTNYECYKGLYSSHVDRNYFEIAYSLNRQFGPDGIYRGLSLYSFADNHDVNRVASNLTKIEHLFPLYYLLFTMPGIPSIYYGSEWGLKGKKVNCSDTALRPKLDLAENARDHSVLSLPSLITRLAAIRKNSSALQHGNYHQLFVDHEQLAFSRDTDQEKILVAVNASDKSNLVQLRPANINGNCWIDLINSEKIAPNQDGSLSLQLPPYGGKIYKMC